MYVCLILRGIPVMLFVQQFVTPKIDAIPDTAVIERTENSSHHYLHYAFCECARVCVYVLFAPIQQMDNNWKFIAEVAKTTTAKEQNLRFDRAENLCKHFIGGSRFWGIQYLRGQIQCRHSLFVGSNAWFSITDSVWILNCWHTHFPLQKLAMRTHPTTPSTAAGIHHFRAHYVVMQQQQ